MKRTEQELKMYKVEIGNYRYDKSFNTYGEAWKYAYSLWSKFKTHVYINDSKFNRTMLEYR